MKPRPNSLIDILAAGFLALAMLSLPLYWARLFCQSMLCDIMPADYSSVGIQPCGLMPPEIENDPNVTYHSQVQSHIISPEAPQALGFIDYLSGNSPVGKRSGVYHLKHDDEDWQWMYFDKSSGRIVCRYQAWERMPDDTTISKMAQIYIGPEGISESPDEDKGRFTSPIVDVSDIGFGQLTWYDKKLRQFFAVKFRKELEFIKGPQLPEDDTHRPVDIGMLEKKQEMLDLWWQPPKAKIQKEIEDSHLITSPPPIIRRDANYRQDEYVLILEESGQINLLDRDTLEFAGTAGYLPTPESLFASKGRVKPRDLLAYRVLPVAFKGEGKYRGMFAAAVSREGTALSLAVFNERGEILQTDYTKGKTGPSSSISSSEAMLFNELWAPEITITRFLLENLQPPVLSVASYFTADSFEAGSGHRALFLLPNSFVAMKGRDARGNFFERFLLALLLILPSIILAGLLARRVSKDAAVVGLSAKARSYWIIGTLALGLVAYITYRLTRPGLALVTCVNCGNPRRPDMEKCHRCGSRWHVPELTPPAWRVLDGARVRNSSTASTEETASQ
ncbi:MAG: hypothetical protein ABIF19_02815 [Planctomycetota bacterium]